jgi:hypothetical protein
MNIKITSKAKRMSEMNGKQFLRDAFRQQQSVLEKQLALAASSITHDGKFGEVTEKHIISILRQYLPHRYSVDSAIVIDRTGRTSDQIDVVIYDKQYTPTILDQHDHRYVPAEAVYAIFEVKPSIDIRRLKYAAKKAASVRRLMRTSVTFRTATGLGRNRRTYIIAGIIAPRCSWSNGFGKAFSKAHRMLRKHTQIDCGLALDSGAFDTFKALRTALSAVDKKNRSTTLVDDDCLVQLPMPFEVVGARYCLAAFLFRLLHILQFIGTVSAIDWTTYSRNFRS